MAVLLTEPYLQFFDENGDPLAFGTIDTYAATTTTRKATYTDSTGSFQAPNPIMLDASGIPTSGNGSVWIQGSYKIVVKSADGLFTKTTDNVTSFSPAITGGANAYFQSFSGNGATTSFTLSQNLGTDENAIMVFVSTPTAGFFQQFSGTGAQTAFTLSKNMGTDSSSLQVFVVNTAEADKRGYEIQPTSAYTVNGTTLTFGVAPVTGTNNIFVSQPQAQSNGAAGVLSPTQYTLNGTNLSFTTAPVTGTNNILVFAPSTLVAAAALSAASADASATAAGNSAASAAGYAVRNKWTFSNATTMTDPGTGGIKLNNATPSAVTAIAISELCANAGNPDLSGWINTWDDGAGSNRGTLSIFKDESNFILYSISGSNVDSGSWEQLSVTYMSSAGSFVNGDTLYLGFAASGITSITGGISSLSGAITASGTGAVVASLGSFSSAQLAAAVTGETGSGALVFGTSPTITGATLTTSTVNGVNLTTGGGTSTFLNANGLYSSPATGVTQGLRTALTSVTSAIISLDFTTYSSYMITLTNFSGTAGTEAFFYTSTNSFSTTNTTTYNIGRINASTAASLTASLTDNSSTVGFIKQMTMILTQDTVTSNPCFSITSSTGTTYRYFGGGFTNATAALNQVKFDYNGNSFSGFITTVPLTAR